MRFLRITNDAGPDEIAEAVRHLRAKQERTELAEVRAELSEDIDELVDLYLERVRVMR